MVESLKRSVQRLAPPACVDCHIEMIWYRAARSHDDPQLIRHYFQCPNCNRVSEAKTKMPKNGDGDKQPPQPAKSRSPRAAAFIAVKRGVADRHGPLTAEHRARQ